MKIYLNGVELEGVTGFWFQSEQDVLHQTAALNGIFGGFYPSPMAEPHPNGAKRLLDGEQVEVVERTTKYYRVRLPDGRILPADGHELRQMPQPNTKAQCATCKHWRGDDMVAYAACVNPKCLERRTAFDETCKEWQAR